MNYWNKATERFYTEKNDGKIDLIFINRNKDVFRELCNVQETMKSGIDGCGLKYIAIKLSWQTYQDIISSINEQSYKQVYADTKEENKGYEISKEQIIKGIKFELSFDELSNIVQRKIEPYNYYNFDLLLEGFKRRDSKKITDKYFSYWAMLWCGLSSNKQKTIKLDKIMALLEDFMDAQSFFDYKDCKEEINTKIDIAEIKYFDFLIRKELDKSIKKFDNNGIEIYLSEPDYCYGKKIIYQVLVVDTKIKKYNCFFVDRPVFNENVNYDFCWDIDYQYEKEFGDYYEVEDIEIDEVNYYEQIKEKYNSNRIYKFDKSINWEYVEKQCVL